MKQHYPLLYATAVLATIASAQTTGGGSNPPMTAEQMFESGSRSPGIIAALHRQQGKVVEPESLSLIRDLYPDTCLGSEIEIKPLVFINVRELGRVEREEQTICVILVQRAIWEMLAPRGQAAIHLVTDDGENLGAEQFVFQTHVEGSIVFFGSCRVGVDLASDDEIARWRNRCCPLIDLRNSLGDWADRLEEGFAILGANGDGLSLSSLWRSDWDRIVSIRIEHGDLKTAQRMSIEQFAQQYAGGVFQLQTPTLSNYHWGLKGVPESDEPGRRWNGRLVAHCETTDSELHTVVFEIAGESPGS